MKHREVLLRTKEGEWVKALAPVILSVSRSTDIPAFYTDWFFNRLQEGYFVWYNPYNRHKSYISFEAVRLIVFFSKNPVPLLSRLDFLEEKGIHCYLHFTLNDYEKEALEPHLNVLEKRIQSFRSLSARLGKEKMIWRYDPLFLTDQLNVDDLLRRAEYIGNQLNGYTRKMVFSYADIACYRHVSARLLRSGIAFREFSEPEMIEWAAGLQSLNRSWGYELATCAEAIHLESYGIVPNKCIDDGLIRRIFPEDKQLMKVIGGEQQQAGLFGDFAPAIRETALRDKGQRPLCYCIPAQSVGEYNTCPHLCKYCYANRHPDKVMENYRHHLENPTAESLV